MERDEQGLGRGKQMNRNKQIFELLKNPNITYKKIGNKFDLSSERIRQIRQDFINQGFDLPCRDLDRKRKIDLLQDEKLSYDDIAKILNIKKNRLPTIANRLRRRGIKVPERPRLRKYNNKYLKILKAIINDDGPVYGQALRLSKKFNVTQQYINNVKHEAGLSRKTKTESGTKNKTISKYKIARIQRYRNFVNKISKQKTTNYVL